MTDEKLTELERLARLPPAGPWSARAGEVFGADGRALLLCLERAPFGRAAGELARYVAAIDPDTVRELVAALRAALPHAEALGNLASAVAHELNNALNALRLKIDLLILRGDGEGPTVRVDRDDLASLSRITDDAVDVVGRLGDLSRRRRDPPDEVIDVGMTVAQAAEMARSAVEDRAPGVRLAVDVVEGLCARARRTEIRQVLVNLLVNAADAARAAPEPGTIRVGVRQADGGSVLIEVEDEGVGLPAGLAHRLFDAFFTTKGAHGTGLGLTLARGVMSRSGGTVEIADRQDRRGARVALRLPLSDRPPSRDPTPAPPLEHKLRVLVVDDDVDNLRAMADLLEHEGQCVVASVSGPEAVRILRLGLQRFDVLLCDVGMPEMSGWEVAAEAREADPKLPVWLITGWASEISPDDPRRRGVSGILGKPADVDQLFRLLSSIPRRDD